MSNTVNTIPKIEDIVIKEEEFEKHKDLPIYKKSLLIRKLTKFVVTKELNLRISNSHSARR